MAAPFPQEARATYTDYEMTLATLLQVPTQRSSGLVAADETAARAKQEADRVFRQSEARIANLRRTANSRYLTAVESLKTHSVLLSTQVQPETMPSGDEGAVRRAMNEHIRAVTVVETEIKAVIRIASQERNEAVSRAQAAQQAALALKLRQDRIRQERAEVKAQAAVMTQRRKRVLIICSALVAVMVVVTIMVIVVFVAK